MAFTTLRRNEMLDCHYDLIFLPSERALTLNLKIPILSDVILLNEESAPWFDAELFLINIITSMTIYLPLSALICSTLSSTNFIKGSRTPSKSVLGKFMLACHLSVFYAKISRLCYFESF